MNLVLFEPSELAAPLPRSDARARHIVEVLRRREGDTFDAGLVNGALGKATLAAIGADAVTLTFEPTREPPPLPAVTLIIGLPRPQTARDILRDATTIGVSAIHFVATKRTDPNYATSSLWTSGEWRRHLLTGAAQAFDTRLPEVSWTHTLESAIAILHREQLRLALDPYEATEGLSGHDGQPTILALGPERGWDNTDRDTLRAAGFTLAHLGQRILRSETAVVAALARIRQF